MSRRYSRPRTFRPGWTRPLLCWLSRCRDGGQVRGGLDHHALSPGGGQVLPPPGGRGDRGGIAGVDGQPAGGGDQVRGGGGQPVGDLQVPRVRALVVDGALGGEQLERGDAHAGQAVGGPAVAQVGGGEGIGVRHPGAGTVEQLWQGRGVRGQGAGGGLLERGDRGGQRGPGGGPDRGVLAAEQLAGLDVPGQQFGVEEQPGGVQLAEQPGLLGRRADPVGQRPRSGRRGRTAGRSGSRSRRRAAGTPNRAWAAAGVRQISRTAREPMCFSSHSTSVTPSEW